MIVRCPPCPAPSPPTSRWPWSAAGWRPTWSTSPTTWPRSTQPGSGPWCCRSRAQPICARFANVRPARPWPGPPWRGPPADAWTSSLVRGRVQGRGAVDPGVDRGRRRVPGEPHPAALGAAAGGRRRGRAGRGARRGQPGAVQRRRARSPPRAAWWRRPRRSGSSGATATSSSRGRSRAPPRTPRGLTGQGPGRERDDRRPRPQRPRAGVRVRLRRRCRRCSPSSTTPGSCTSCRPSRGRLRPGCGWADAIAATFPPGLGHRRAEARRPRAHRRARAGAPRRLLRRGRAGSTPTAARATSTSPSARSGSRTAQLHFGTGGGITWDSDPDDEWAETELKARHLLRVASGSGRWPMTEQVWLNGSLVDADRRHRLDLRPRAHRRRRRLRDAQGRRRAAVRPPPPPRAAAALGGRASTCGCPYDDDVLRAAMAEVLASPRPARSPGCASPSPAAWRRSARSAARTSPRWSSPSARSTDAEPSTAVCVVPWPRNERGALAGIKTTSYAENVMALACAKARGLHRGDLRHHHRPALRGHRLQRVRRRRRPAPHPAARRPAAWPASPATSCSRSPTPSRRTSPWRPSSAADEVFLTSTGRDVQPVAPGRRPRAPRPRPPHRGRRRRLPALVATTDDP